MGDAWGEGIAGDVMTRGAACGAFCEGLRVERLNMVTNSLSCDG